MEDISVPWNNQVTKFPTLEDLQVESCRDCRGTGCNGCLDTGRAGEKYRVAGAKLGELVARKNAAYGDAITRTGDFLAILFPAGIDPSSYRDVALLVRMFDKQMRVAHNKHALGESPYRDIAGYGLLGLVADESQK